MGCREFDPVEAAYAVVQYMPAYPPVWVEQCALAGVQLCVTSDCRLGQFWDDPADQTQAKFLTCSLNLTPGGTAAVVEYLRQQKSA